MKTTNTGLTLLLFIIILSTSRFAAAADTLPFVIGEWAPYTGAKIENNGMATEIVSAACLAVGLVAEYTFEPWVRAENSVLEGTKFGTFPYKKLPNRQDNYIFSDILFSSHFAIITYKGNVKTSNFKYLSDDNFKCFTIGVVAGTDAIRIPLEKAGAKIEAVPTAEQNLRKLRAGRIDFYVDDSVVIRHTLERLFATDVANFIFLDKNYGSQNNFRIMASTKYPDSSTIIEKINAGLAEIKENGELAKILTRYGL